MRKQKYHAIDDAIMTSMSEEQFALWRREQGARVLKHGGGHWEESTAGLYQGIHWLARMSVRNAARPTSFCWGFRTTVSGADGALANGAMPVHLLSNVDGYDFEAISSRRRNKIKNSRRHVQIIEIDTPELLYREGYDIVRSAHERTGYGRLPGRLAWQKMIGRYFTPRRGLIIAGLVDGQLGGYAISFAVGPTVYIHDVQLATGALRTNIGTLLIFELMQACRRSGLIREAVYGQHAPENQSLCQYKQEMEFPVVRVPSRVWVSPVLEAVLRKIRPYAYYRLTGQSAERP